ncbi:MAG: hypothetical protein R2825_29060 [Saprospiraceae bacterium]
MRQYYISFWNVENLFDIQHSPRRTDKVERAIGGDLEDWTQPVLDRKISQLASIISKLNDGKGPDVLGVCEIENEYVLGLLVQALNPLGRNYAIVHHDSQDGRGIDVAFIYDETLLTVEPGMIFNHVVMKRTATRDILQVNFLTTHLNQRLVLIANHWPSRRGDPIESEGFRIIAGETLSYFHQRIKEVHGNDTPILAMGDFNDEPFDRSITSYARALRSKTKVIRGISPYFLNLTWPLLKEGCGSYFYDNFPNLFDQFLANKNLLEDDSPLRVRLDSVQINNFLEMVNPAFDPAEPNDKYPYPVRYGGMGKSIDPDGFSDHFPISVVLEQDD